MKKKPTYEELEKQVQELEHEFVTYKQTEEALRTSEERYRIIAEAYLQGTYQVDRNERLTFANQRTAEITGYTLEELDGLPMDQIFPKSEAKAALDANVAKLSSGESVVAENLITRKDGREASIRFCCVPLFDEGGEYAGFTGSILDITDRKQAENALRDSEEKYRAVVENANEGIVIAQDGMLKYVNSKLCDIVGFSKEDLMSRPYIELVHPDDRLMIMQYYKKRLKGEEIPDEYTFRGLSKNGDVKWVENKGVLITWEDKPATLSLLTDITERKEIEKALQKSEEKYRSMMESMKDASYICSPELHIEYMNPAMIDRIGSGATGKICHKTIYDRDKKCSWCVFDQVKKGEHIDYEMADPKDSRYYSVSNSPIFSINGTVSKLTIFHDITARKLTEKALENEMKLRNALIEALPYPTMLIKKNKTVIFANKVARDVGARIGGICWQDFGHSDYIPEKDKEYINQHKTTKGLCSHCTFCLADEALSDLKPLIAPEVEAFGKIFETYWVPISSNLYLHYSLDITEKKRVEEALQASHEILEEKVQERTADLEEMNTALTVLLKKRDEDKSKLEENIFTNYKSLISPFLLKLKNSLTKRDQQILMGIVESNLKESLKPFSTKLSDPMVNLTPAEIQIASFIKHGSTTKEIAQTLNCSPRTIDGHRDNIRKKLNIKKKNINLRTLLLNL